MQADGVHTPSACQEWEKTFVYLQYSAAVGSANKAEKEGTFCYEGLDFLKKILNKFFFFKVHRVNLFLSRTCLYSLALYTGEV